MSQIYDKWNKVPGCVDYDGSHSPELGGACYLLQIIMLCFPGGSDSKEYTCNAVDLGLSPGLGRVPGGGHGNPLQYSFLENPMDRGGWWDLMGSQRVGTTKEHSIAHTSSVPDASSFEIHDFPAMVLPCCSSTPKDFITCMTIFLSISVFVMSEANF